MTDTDKYRGVLVFIKKNQETFTKNSLNLISLGRVIADELETELSVILAGDSLGALPDKLVSYGTDIVYAIDNPMLKRYTTSCYQKIVCDLIKKSIPEIVLFDSDDTGMDLAPRVACELQTGLSAHCMELKIDKNTRQLLQVCPYFDHMATILTDTRPQIATVQAGIKKELVYNENRKGKIINIAAVFEKQDVKILSVTKKEDTDIKKMEDADVIVAVGRGMKNIKLAEELAAVFNGVIGATQAVIDAELLSESHMIGQTGRVVQPKLYIACGISGAGQHIVGMQNSGTIVAINTDENAPIFKVADYGIVDDTSKVIPEILKILKIKNVIKSE